MEDNKILNCTRKSHFDIINEEMKEISSEEEDIGICKFRRRSRVEIMNEEVKGWTSSSKQQESPPEPTNTKEDICLEQMKRKVKRADLKWYDFLLQEKLKSLIYVDCSLRVHPMEDNFIDELNFQNCVSLRRKTTSKLSLLITYKKRKFIIHPEYFDANNIFSHPFIQNLKHKPNMVQYLSRQMKISLKNTYWKTVPNIKYTK